MSEEKLSLNSYVNLCIEKGDMESLINIVLEGRGNALEGKSSSNLEIQEFLNNVKRYQEKISGIHKAAFEGNIWALRSRLDRKKLALAQDELGRTALHHAVLGNQKEIVKYLLRTYPESSNEADREGRTALHYAAVMDNEFGAEMYKELLKCNNVSSKVKDKMGNFPEVYLRRKDLVKMDDLLVGNPQRQNEAEFKEEKAEGLGHCSNGFTNEIEVSQGNEMVGMGCSSSNSSAICVIL